MQEANICLEEPSTSSRNTLPHRAFLSVSPASGQPCNRCRSTRHTLGPRQDMEAAECPLTQGTETKRGLYNCHKGWRPIPDYNA